MFTYVLHEPRFFSVLAFQQFSDIERFCDSLASDFAANHLMGSQGTQQQSIN